MESKKIELIKDLFWLGQKTVEFLEHPKVIQQHGLSNSENIILNTFKNSPNVFFDEAYDCEIDQLEQLVDEMYSVLSKAAQKIAGFEVNEFIIRTK